MEVSRKRIVTVLGATGVQGGAVVRHLSSLGDFDIRATSRTPSSSKAQALTKLPNVSLWHGDMSAPETLKGALTGAEAVFIVTNFYDLVDNSMEEARQGCRMADLAEETGIKLFIWSSIKSALVRTGARYKSNPLVENKSVVTRYLEYKKIPHVVVYLGWYYDNFTNWNCISKAEDDSIVLTQPLLSPNAPQGFCWVEKDLGPTVAAILAKYRTDQEVLKREIFAVSRHDTLGNVVREIEKQSGRKVVLKTPTTTGIKDLDELYGYENEYGILTDIPLPDPWTVSLGVEFHGLEQWVREVALPYINAL
ncbi:NAD(P)-binding protein [Pyrenochaeta sp. DS3sAY3a]|nr:NAD(P)-binding protein [Pyrenochaeta sp. DS3sAY3a]